MPKIIVREFDNSKTATTSTTSFAVVVPGRAYNSDREIGDGYFDENGIYDCTSQADFKKYVGLGGESGSTLDAQAPTLTVIGTDPETGKDLYKSKLEADEFYNTYRDAVYTAEAISETGESVGYLKGHIGESESTIYKFIKASTWNAKIDYVVIEKGNEGNDEQIGYQTGNQIAWELLGLGYEVLYKLIDDTTIYSKPDGTEVKGLAALETAEFWAPLKDKSMYKFRYITTGGYYGAAAMNRIVEVAAFNDVSYSVSSLAGLQTIDDASGRGDCIALLDLDEEYFDNGTPSKLVSSVTTAVNAITYLQSYKYAGKYSAIFAPRVTYDLLSDEDVHLAKTKFSNNETFPASFHYLACAAQSMKKFAEWYAVAGVRRGYSDLFKITSTTYKFGELVINTLAPRTTNEHYGDGGILRACNLILTERDDHYIWGNRTAANLISADKNGDLHFRHYLNIRQLCCTIKQHARAVCRELTFDPNSDALWLSFVNGMSSLLDKMKADNGIIDYKIEKIVSDQKGLVRARISIIPIEAAEDFDIGLYLRDSLSGIVVDSTEAE